MTFKIAENCIGCGTCVEICPLDTIRLNDEGKAFIAYGDDCMTCFKCERLCPAGAISGTPRHAHTIDVSKCLKCGACMEKCKFGAIFRS